MIKIIEYGKDDLKQIFSRSQINDTNVINNVQKIIDDIKSNGDKALFSYIEKFDKQKVDNKSLTVTREEIENAYKNVDSKLLDSLKLARDNIYEYHLKQVPKSFIDCSTDSKIGWIMRPINRAALYVPGGKAAYPSTVLMCGLPAKAAGVKDIVMATPNAMPLTLIAADLCGIKTIYKMGGAHAIAALCYGTESIEKADVIAGPGNVYVTMAKKLCYGECNIDMIAGPSEILIIADDTAKPEYVAADLLSQAEHDEQAAAILITTSRELAEKVKNEVARQTEYLERKQIINASIEKNGAIIIVSNIEKALEVANKIAPEHLEICTENADYVAMGVKNAGAVFIGNYSPEPLGDYFAGPSHTLPTSGTARYFSVLNVNNFMKRMSYINYTKNDLFNASEHIINLSKAEGLTAHTNAINVRINKEKI
jgi:histidinol dehydrogenase